MIEQARAEKKQAEATVEVSRAGVASAEAKVAEIQAGIRRAEADVARWRSEFARIEQLFRERAQTGSLLDETRNKLRAAEATAGGGPGPGQVRRGRARRGQGPASTRPARTSDGRDSHVEVARFEAERAEAMAGYTKIVAPFDGVVTRRKVDTGQLTTPGATGEPLFVVARSDIVTISVGVPETDAPFVNAGDAATGPPARPRRPDVRGQGDPDRLGPRRRRPGRSCAEIDLPEPGRRPPARASTPTRRSSPRSTRTP